MLDLHHAAWRWCEMTDILETLWHLLECCLGDQKTDQHIRTRQNELNTTNIMITIVRVRARTLTKQFSHRERCQKSFTAYHQMEQNGIWIWIDCTISTYTKMCASSGKYTALLFENLQAEPKTACMWCAYLQASIQDSEFPCKLISMEERITSHAMQLETSRLFHHFTPCGYFKISSL